MPIIKLEGTYDISAIKLPKQDLTPVEVTIVDGEYFTGPNH